MPRIPLICSVALAACTPSPQDAAMPVSRSGPHPTADTRADEARSDDQGTVGLNMAGRAAGQSAQAAKGPIPQAVSAADNLAPAMTPDPSAEALGRRTLSTAFVRIGPDGYLTVALHDDRVLVLRDVVMGPGKYCGTQISGARHCGPYGDVATARPGGGPAPHAS